MCSPRKNTEKKAVWKRKTKRKRAKSEVMRGCEWVGEEEKSCKCEIKSEQSEKRSNTHTHTRTRCGESHSSVLNNALGVRESEDEGAREWWARKRGEWENWLKEHATKRATRVGSLMVSGFPHRCERIFSPQFGRIAVCGVRSRENVRGRARAKATTVLALARVPQHAESATLAYLYGPNTQEQQKPRGTGECVYLRVLKIDKITSLNCSWWRRRRRLEAVRNSEGSELYELNWWENRENWLRLWGGAASSATRWKQTPIHLHFCLKDRMTRSITFLYQKRQIIT